MASSSGTVTAPVTADPPTGGGRPRAVVARWEFRWMERELPVDPVRLGRWMAGAAVASVETYFVSFRTAHNVKIRHGTVDLKRLLEVSEEGVERWVPVLKTPFPLDATAVREICGAWGLLPPPGAAGWPTLEALRNFVDEQPDLRSVELAKQRRRIEDLRCPGELVEVTVADRHWKSLAFEHEDLQLVRAVLMQLGLDPRQNLNYPAALKRLFLRSQRPVHAGEGVL